MSDETADEIRVTKELLRELQRRNYFYAFSPVIYPEKDAYSMNVRLIHAIYEVLDDYGINKSSHGYTYIIDAVCIVIDLRTLDVCLINDVYPRIAFKYRLRDISSVEHDIRNSIKAAYNASLDARPAQTGLIKYYRKRPSNKALILDTVQKVGQKLLEQSE